MKTSAENEQGFEVRFAKEGKSWSAVISNKEGAAAYGNTPEEAFHNLFVEKGKLDYQKEIHSETQPIK